MPSTKEKALAHLFWGSFLFYCGVATYFLLIKKKKKKKKKNKERITPSSYLFEQLQLIERITKLFVLV